ncbi:MAG: proton-conducting transporter membrane subunit, partial [Myxococcota bacterium]
MATLIWVLLLGASALFAVSGWFRARLAGVVAVLAAVTGISGTALSLTMPQPVELSFPWPVPLGRFAIGLDAMSVAFLVVVLVIPALGAVYGAGYFAPSHPTARRTRLAYGVLPAAMIFVVVARDAMVLLVAWEVMALAAFVAISADDHEPHVRESSWVYLIATHIGTLCLIAAFAVVAKSTGDLSLRVVTGLGSGATLTVAALFWVGFGMKAGLMPLHVWLPGAHANAPSHVSAVMSGVVLKMGVYGLLRMASLLPELDATAGAVLLALGATSTVLGAAFAVAQSDLKRLLAYSSIDNIGIAAMGIGLAIIGRAHGRADLVVLGIVGATLHVWNHALFKPLLFFVAGSVIHETGTRSMDRLGGLAKRLPKTSRAALIGAVALAGLPPLNGFASELVIYTGLFRAALVSEWAALAAPALAMGGALTLVAMLKLYGSVFLGSPRTTLAGGEHG